MRPLAQSQAIPLIIQIYCRKIILSIIIFKKLNLNHFIRFTLNEEKVRKGSGRNIVHSTFVSDVAIYKKTPENNVSVIMSTGEENQANNEEQVNITENISSDEDFKTPIDKKLQTLLNSVNIQ